MASVNTNAAAITALRTLQMTQAQLDATQSRISTGYKIGEAKDNAAYWAISTTLKSDNKALGTVKDALNLGSATVDVAYQSLNKAKDVLDEIKSKLVAATQDGVDKTKIQSEITELQKQLKAIAASATFAGENWLNVDTSVAGTNLTKKVVSSYGTDGAGSVSIGTISIDTSSMVLINNAAGKEGILNGGKDGMTSAMTGGIATSTATAATSGQKVATLAAAAGTETLAGSDNLTINYKVDGQTYSFSVAYATYSAYTGAAAINGTSVDATKIGTFLNSVLTNNSDLLSRATVSTASGAITITSKTKGTNSTAEFTGFSFGTAGFTNTPVQSGATTGANAYTTMTTNFTTAGAMTLDDNDALTFDVLQGASPSQTTTRVTVNKALISDVLSSTDGKISNVNDYKAVLTQALKNAGLSNLTVSDTSGAITLTGTSQLVSVANVTTSTGTDLTSFDMSNATSQQLSALISAVNSATQRVVTAAATLGSVASRIDLQKTFVNTLMDTIDKGVSNLVDADMSEESTKLQALQVKQQLGTQALSIANQSAQSLLSLFRSNT